jgi:pilus assembly protein Flp/PilA
MLRPTSEQVQECLISIVAAVSGAGRGDFNKRERDAMNKLMTSVKDFLVSEDGPTAVEYAVMLALIVVVCIGTVRTIGTNANAKFLEANKGLT